MASSVYKTIPEAYDASCDDVTCMSQTYVFQHTRQPKVILKLIENLWPSTLISRCKAGCCQNGGASTRQCSSSTPLQCVVLRAVIGIVFFVKFEQLLLGFIKITQEL